MSPPSISTTPNSPTVCRKLSTIAATSDGFASGTYSDWMGRLELFLKQGGFIPGGRE